MRRVIAALAAAGFAFAPPTFAAEPIRPAPFEPPLWCAEVFGADIRAGLRERLLDTLRGADWLSDGGTLSSQSFIEALWTLDPTRSEIEEIVADANLEDRMEGLLKLRLATIKGDWDHAYEAEPAKWFGLGGVFLLARAEARAMAAKGEPIEAVERLRAARERLADAPDENHFAKRLREETQGDLMLGVTVLRELMMIGDDEAAVRFADRYPALRPFEEAMTLGRVGRPAAFERLLADSEPRDELRWAGDMKLPTSPAAEAVFQAVAAKRWDLFDAMAEAADMRFSSAVTTLKAHHDLLIASRDEEALLLAHAVLSASDRSRFAHDTVTAALAQRGDSATLAALKALVEERDGLPSPNLTRSLVAAHARAERFEEARTLISRTPLTAIAQTMVRVQGKEIPQGSPHGTGELVPGYVAVLADDEMAEAILWDMSLRHRAVLKMVRAARKPDWDAIDAVLDADKERGGPVFGNRPWLAVNYAAQAAAFLQGDRREIESWYDWAMKKPLGRTRYLLDWTRWAQVECTGWPVKLFPTLEVASEGYAPFTPAFAVPSRMLVQ